MKLVYKCYLIPFGITNPYEFTAHYLKCVIIINLVTFYIDFNR